MSRGIAERFGVDLRWGVDRKTFKGRPLSLVLYPLQALIKSFFPKNPECSDFQVLDNFPKMGIIIPIIFISRQAA